MHKHTCNSNKILLINQAKGVNNTHIINTKYETLNSIRNTFSQLIYLVQSIPGLITVQTPCMTACMTACTKVCSQVCVDDTYTNRMQSFDVFIKQLIKRVDDKLPGLSSDTLDKRLITFIFNRAYDHQMHTQNYVDHRDCADDTNCYCRRTLCGNDIMFMMSVSVYDYYVPLLCRKLRDSLGVQKEQKDFMKSICFVGRDAKDHTIKIFNECAGLYTDFYNNNTEGFLLYPMNHNIGNDTQGIASVLMANDLNKKRKMAAEAAGTSEAADMQDEYGYECLQDLAGSSMFFYVWKRVTSPHDMTKILIMLLKEICKNKFYSDKHMYNSLLICMKLELLYRSHELRHVREYMSADQKHTNQRQPVEQDVSDANRQYMTLLGSKLIKRCKNAYDPTNESALLACCLYDAIALRE